MRPPLGRFRNGAGLIFYLALCYWSWNLAVKSPAAKQRREAHNQLYRKTPKGFLMRAYQNMRARVEGRSPRPYLWQGLPILSRQQFYDWTRDNPEFWRLFRQWVAHNYDQKFTPCVNRIRTTEGYELGNIEWLTFSVNASLAGQAPKRPRQTRQHLLELYAHTQASTAS